MHAISVTSPILNLTSPIAVQMSLQNKLIELRSTYASLPDALSGRMPLAYVQLVQLLTDGLILTTPFALGECQMIPTRDPCLSTRPSPLPPDPPCQYPPTAAATAALQPPLLCIHRCSASTAALHPAEGRRLESRLSQPTQ